MADNGATHVHVPMNGGYATNPYGHYSPFASIEHMSISNRVDDAAGKVLDSIHTSGRFTNKEVSDSTRLVNKEVCDSTRNVLDAVAGSTLSLKDGQSVQYVNLRDAVERTGVANLSAIERNHGEARLLIQSSSGELRGLVDRNNANVLLSAKDTLLEMCKFHSQTQLQLSETENRLGRQASENVAAIQLEACKNREAISKQLAECCCELKEKIDIRATETNLLIRETENQRVRDALNAANTENMLMKLVKSTSGPGNSS